MSVKTKDSSAAPIGLRGQTIMRLAKRLHSLTLIQLHIIAFFVVLFGSLASPETFVTFCWITASMVLLARVADALDSPGVEG